MEEVTKNISCALQIIDIARFMSSSLSSLVNNLSEGIIINRIQMFMLSQKLSKKV